MPETPPPAPTPDDANAAPWERPGAKPAGSLPGGATTGWHDTRKGKDRSTQVAVTIGLFFCLLGLLGGLIYRLAPPQRTVELIAIPVSQYKWGTNPTADRDADKLLAQFGQENGGRGSALQSTAGLKKLLAGLAERDASVPLVLFVSSLSVVHENRVYLLPADAPLDQPDNWLALADLLARFHECPAAEKALILDIARSPVDPFRGPLHDDVASQIDRELTAFQPSFPVLCSCSPGEHSLTIPERGNSAFAEYLAEGLAGEADGYFGATKEPDRKITFAELAEFTACRVSQWADQVPDARQMPKPYGPDGSGFVLFRGRTRAAPPEEATPAPAVPPYPQELLKGWEVRDAARNDIGIVLAPDLILELEAALLRAEERYLIGLDVADPRNPDTWKTAVKRLAERMRILESSSSLRASLTDHRAGRKEASAELTAALDKWMRIRFPVKDETGKAPPPPAIASAEVEKELEKVLTDDTALDAFWYLWNVKLVTGTGLTPERIANVSTVLDERCTKLPLTNEQFLLRRIALSKLPSEAYPDVVRALLQAEQAHSDAMAATGSRLPEGFFRVQKLLTAGHAAKVAGEALLFKVRPTPDDLVEARKQFTIASENLKAATLGATAVRSARRAWADGAVRLHESLPGTIASDRPASRDWLEAADTAAKIATRLAASEDAFDKPQFEALEGLTKQLQSSINSKLKLITSEDVKLLDQKAQLRPQTVRFTELQKLLAGAVLPAGERAALAAGYRKVSAQRFHAAKTRFEREPVMVRTERPEPPKAFLQTQRRADASIELLRLAGYQGADAMVGAARISSNDYSKWQTLDDRLRKAWMVEMPEQAVLAAKQGQWGTVERIVRAAPARIDGFDPESGFGELFGKEEVARRIWMKE